MGVSIRRCEDSWHGRDHRSSMHCTNVLHKIWLVVSPVWAVRAKIGSFACMSQDVLFQISLPGTTREHLAALAAYHNVLVTTTLQSKHTPSAQTFSSSKNLCPIHCN